jgi:hypothetical protein
MSTPAASRNAAAAAALKNAKHIRYLPYFVRRPVPPKTERYALQQYWTLRPQAVKEAAITASRRAG